MTLRPRSWKQRMLLVAAVLAAVYCLTVVLLARNLVSPNRPRISHSIRPTIGLEVHGTPEGSVLVDIAVPPSSDVGLGRGDRVLRLNEAGIAGAEHFRATILGLRAGESVSVAAIKPEGTGLLADITVVERAVSPSDLGLDYRDVAFTNRRGMLLRGWYVPPPATAGDRHPAVAYGHDRSGDRRDWLPVCPAVHRAGFGQLLFDFAGRGDSEGGSVSLGLQEAGDLEAALDFLAGLREIDGAGLALVGREMGGAAAILAAESDPRPKALVLDSPIISLRETTDRMLWRYRLPPIMFRSPVYAVMAIWGRFDPYELELDEVTGSLETRVTEYRDADQLAAFLASTAKTHAAY